MIRPRKSGSLPIALAMLLLTPLGVFAQPTVTLSPTASPSAGQAGVTVVSVLGSGFPSGIIPAASVSVALRPATPGGGPSGAATATAVTTIIGTTRSVTFQIPQTIAVAAPTPYRVSISGSTSTGTTFASSNAAALTVNPPASIASISPNSGAPGQTLTISINTANTNFLQGSTMASFGVGISVGGGPEGEVGPVTVTNPAIATAQLVIDQNALAGFRSVVVQTGVQQATLANGFNVATANHPPVANAGGPYAGTVGQTITFDGTKSHDPDGDTLTYTWNFGDSATASGAQPTHIYTAVGTYTVSLTVNDGRGGTDTATTTATIGPTTGPTPTVSITSPAGLSLLNKNPISVTGNTNNAGDTVKVDGVQAAMSGESFSVQITLQEGSNVITATATDPSGSVATASITVTLDTTPPRITINTPANGSVVTTPAVTVTGLANDITAGTVNTQDVAVTVNGITAQVSNRNFLADAVPLSPGRNTITAVGVDKAGNTASASITVVYTQATGKPAISLVSGNNQSGTIGTQLPQPLGVALKDASGHPVAGQVVVFQITENNGTLTGNSVTGNNTGHSIAVKTDSNGLAQVMWTLGMRAGAGNNCVMAAAVNFFGEVDFTAIATPSTPGLISLDSGNTQTGVIGQALPLPFVVVVTDSGHNRLPNIPVTFTVKQGGGSFNGQSSVTMNTDSNGRVLVVLTLGMQEGINNNLVEANFVGNMAFPASFTASGQAVGDPAATEVSGVVLDDEDTPIAGVTMSIEGTALTTQTDPQGQFALKGVPVGAVKLVADATTADRPGTWELMSYDMVTVAGQNNTLTMPIYLLPLDLAEGIHVDATHGGTITLAQVPGFSLTIPPGSVTFPDGTKSGLVSVTLVHADKVPMTPQFGQQPRFIVSIQPTGVHFDPPAAMTIPNVDGLKPGEVTEMYSYDHDLGMFVAIGTGTVSEDGTVIKSDPGVGITKGGWHCGGNPTTTGTTHNCGTCQTCTGNSCVPSSANTNCGPCWSGGSCSASGSCSGGTPLPYGASCGSCYNGGICDGNGNCLQGTSGANGANCNQNPCLTGQTCQNGTCSSGTPAGAGTLCQINFNPCVTGVCNGSGNCINAGNTPAGTSCNNLCVSGGTCDGSGTCAGGTPKQCSNGNPCDGQETCDPSNGGCQPATSKPTVGTTCGICTAGATCDSSGSCSGGSPFPQSSSCGPCFTGGSCDGNGSCVGGTQLPNGTSCGVGGTCEDGNCLGSTQISVTKIWSDQFSGVLGNYLPGGAGSVGTTANYILVGARVDGNAYMKAEIQLAPDTPSVRANLLVSLKNVASGLIQSANGSIQGNVVSFQLSPGIGVETYLVVAGVDTNNDGQLEDNEILTTSPWSFKVVSRPTYFGALSTLQSVVLGGWLTSQPIAATFLQSFLDDSAIPGANVVFEQCFAGAGGPCAGGNPLDHNAGAVLSTNSDGSVSGLVRDNFILPQTLVPSSILSSAALCEGLNLTVLLHRSEVRNKLANGSDGQYQFPPWPMFGNTGSTSAIQFTPVQDPDLFDAFGAAIISATVATTFRLSNGQIQLASNSISGNLSDVYQWNYSDPSLLNESGAVLEAGYNTLGSAGHVFKETVDLAGAIAGCAVSPFSASPTNDPSIASISPNVGQRGQTVTVTITGNNTHFVQGLTQVNVPAGIAVSNLNVYTYRALTVQVSISSYAPAGAIDVTVATGPEVVTAISGFTVR